MTMDPPVNDRRDHDNGNNNSGDQDKDDTDIRESSAAKMKKIAVHKSRRERVNFLEDPPEEWTYDRQIAMYLLKNTKWYTQTPTFKQQEELNNEIGKEKDKKAKEEQEQHQGGGNKDDDSSSVTDDKAQESLSAIDALDEYGLVEKRKKRSTEEEDEIQRALNAEAFAYPFTESPYHGPPSLEKAWAYFEHNTLARYKVKEEDDDDDTDNQREGGQRDPVGTDDDGGEELMEKPFLARIIDRFSKGDQKLERAQPGESTVKTRLYSVLWTPHRQIGDFGIGIGLLFSNERAIGILCILAIFLNIPNFIYFSGTEYNNGDVSIKETSFLLKGSAICSNYEYVPCLGCTLDNYERNRFALAVDENGELADGFAFVVKNNCLFDDFISGIINISTLCLFGIGMICMYRYTKWHARLFDEDEATASDYSIVIQNPPRNAKDPEEWRAFFEGLKSELEVPDLKVQACTIGVGNDELVRRLVERREKLRRIAALVDPGIKLEPETLERLAKLELKRRQEHPSIFPRLSAGIPELLKRIEKLNTKILYLTKKSYDVTNVFITFEKERHKRVVLEKMALNRRHVRRKDSTGLQSENFVFRKKKVLLIREADEPSAVRWADLNTNLEFRRTTTIVSGLATVLFLYFAVGLVQRWSQLTTFGSSYLITAFNIVYPQIARIMVNHEGHHSEGDRQRSLYFKITVFLVGNLFYATWTTTPFTSTIADKEADPRGLITRLNALFFSEITLTAVMQASDFMGVINRHILAPRAKTQEDMLFYMRGSEIEIAERYTRMTILVFLALWGSSIYPAGFFMCWVAMGFKYWLDRLSLMRHWQRIPEVGPETAELTNKYVFAIALVMMAVISGVMFGGFPFDNLCTLGEPVPDEFHRTWIVRPKIVDKESWLSRQIFGDDQSQNIEVQIDSNTTAHFFCLQDWRRSAFWEGEVPDRPIDFAFEFSMQPEQAFVAYIFFFLALACILVGLLYYCCVGCRHLCKVSGYQYNYTPRGRDEPRGYSELEDGIGIYVPQVKSSQFNYPLLACRVDKLPECIFEWHDPGREYTYYDMTQDVERLLLGDILRLCDNVLDVKPEVMLRGLLEESKGEESDNAVTRSPAEMEKVLRKKVRRYFKDRLIFSIVKEWHHSDPDKRASVVDKDGLATAADGVEITAAEHFNKEAAEVEL